MKYVFKRFKLILLAYVFFIVLWFVAKLFQTSLTPFFETKEGFNLGDGFYTSWLASLSEDILFFGVIGFLGLILSTRLPQDENFNIRIDSIANGRKVGGKAREYLKLTIKRFLVYNDSATINIIIKSIDKASNVAEIYTSYESILTNMCKDVVYPLKTNAYIKPTHQLRDDYGYISYLGIKEEGNPANNNILIEGDIHKLNKDGFRKETLFNVPANGAAAWKFCYSIWQSINGNKENNEDWFYVATAGFSENINIVLINQTEHDLSYDLRFIDRNSRETVPKTIPNLSIKGTASGKRNREALIQNSQAFDYDKFELFLQCAQ